MLLGFRCCFPDRWTEFFGWKLWISCLSGFVSLSTIKPLRLGAWNMCLCLIRCTCEGFLSSFGLVCWYTCYTQNKEPKFCFGRSTRFSVWFCVLSAQRAGDAVCGNVRIMWGPSWRILGLKSTLGFLWAWKQQWDNLISLVSWFKRYRKCFPHILGHREGLFFLWETICPGSARAVITFAWQLLLKKCHPGAILFAK